MNIVFNGFAKTDRRVLELMLEGRVIEFDTAMMVLAENWDHGGNADLILNFFGQRMLDEGLFPLFAWLKDWRCSVHIFPPEQVRDFLLSRITYADLAEALINNQISTSHILLLARAHKMVFEWQDVLVPQVKFFREVAKGKAWANLEISPVQAYFWSETEVMMEEVNEPFSGGELEIALNDLGLELCFDDGALWPIMAIGGA